MENKKENQETPWYSTNPTQKGAGAMSRRQAILKYRSPATYADELLRICSWGVQPLLLCFCVFLSFSSYRTFFAHNFGETTALIGAGILALVIEIGKIKIGGFAIQTPFLSGVEGLKTSFPQFAVWACAVGITIATFTMSIINSTRGAHALAMQGGFERTEASFSTNTADIDAEIKAANERIQTNQKTKWRGVVTYQAQKAIEKDTRTIAALQAQKDRRTTEQREDFERTRQHNDSATEHGANWIMAAGGWVELLQILCLIAVAACMATIGEVMDQEKEQSRPLTHAYSSNGNVQYSRANGTPKNEHGAQFRWSGYGTEPPPPRFGVSHHAGGVTHQNGTASDSVLLWMRKKIAADMSNFHSRKHTNSGVSKRINEALNEGMASMSDASFCPTRQTAISTHQFLLETFEKLNSYGWPYDNQAAIMARINQILEPEPV